ncbi:hypothetical protein OCU04_000246 [Sclerotinia nivalis]|uniref:Prion-inhibition and propagation HeLo domain-containing protein n=1 Tax=Sclerotinia nivalis TaxID=352851 RepID=A0A9X0AVP4_9HELO|nr:hypothetical protein OCU04_000246 [Sclerotinia nivalis]
MTHNVNIHQHPVIDIPYSEAAFHRNSHTSTLIPIQNISGKRSIMAEAAGLVIGSISLASIFSACVDTFKLVKVAKDAGIDFETNTIKLDLLQLRLTRWGTVVRIEEQEAAMASDDQEKIRGALQQLAKLFTRANEKSVQIHDPNELPTQSSNASQKIRDLAAKYRKRKGDKEKWTTMQKCKWALHTADEMQKLVDDIVLILESLEKILPCSKGMENLVPNEIEEISHIGSQGLEIVSRVAKECSVDPLLEKHVEDAIACQITARASVAENRVGEFARFHVGDTGRIDGGRTDPRPNTNTSNVVGNNITGRGRMQVGDDYTGRSIWD